MKRFLTFVLALAFAVTGHAYTVTGNLQDLGFNAINTPVLFIPESNPQTLGATLDVGATMTVYPTNGIISTNIAQGNYTVRIAPYSFRIAVPSGAGTNTLGLLAIGGLNTYTYTNAQSIFQTRVDGADTTSGYLAEKLGVSGLLSLSTNNTGGNEKLVIGTGGVLPIANGGTAGGDIVAARTNLGGMRYNGDTASLGNGFYVFPNFAGITGDAIGQPYMSRYGQLWHWDGSAWQSGLQLANALFVFSSGSESQIIVGDPANTIDNCLMLQNTNSQHFSAERFVDRFNNEVGAMGYGNDAASIYRTNLFWERFNNSTAMGFAGGLAGGGRGIYGGVTTSANDFLWYNNAGFPNGAVALRMEAATGNLTNSGNFTAGGIIKAGTTAAQITTTAGNLNVAALDATGDGAVHNLTVNRLAFAVKGSEAAPSIDVSGNGSGMTASSAYDFMLESKGSVFFNYVDSTRYGYFTNSMIGFGDASTAPTVPKAAIDNGGASNFRGVVTNNSTVYSGSAQQSIMNASGVYTKMNGETLGGVGTPYVVGSLSQVGVAGAAGSGALVTLAASGTGLYLLSCYFEVTTIGTAGTITLNVFWTDDNGAQSTTLVTTLSLTAKAFISPFSRPIHPIANSAVTYNVTTSGATGSPIVSYWLTLTRLN